MSDMGTFNAEQFLDMVMEEALSTRAIPIPPGTWEAQIHDLSIRTGVNKESGEPWRMLMVRWRFLSPEVQEITQRENPQITQSMFLQLSPQGGLLFGPNDNVELGRLRTALRQNESGKPWAPNHMKGQLAKLEIVAKTNETGDIYGEIKTVHPY